VTDYLEGLKRAVGKTEEEWAACKGLRGLSPHERHALRLNEGVWLRGVLELVQRGESKPTRAARDSSRPTTRGKKAARPDFTPVLPTLTPTPGPAAVIKVTGLF
jgi:hypothetical protein